MLASKVTIFMSSIDAFNSNLHYYAVDSTGLHWSEQQVMYAENNFYSDLFNDYDFDQKIVLPLS